MPHRQSLSYKLHHTYWFEGSLYISRVYNNTAGDQSIEQSSYIAVSRIACSFVGDSSTGCHVARYRIVSVAVTIKGFVHVTVRPLSAKNRPQVKENNKTKNPHSRMNQIGRAH